MNYDAEKLIDQLNTVKVKCNHSNECKRICYGNHFLPHKKSRSCKLSICEIIKLVDKKEVKVECLPI